jgi:hypothetical protein
MEASRDAILAKSQFGDAVILLIRGRTVGKRLPLTVVRPISGSTDLFSEFL